jgi:hypothetical protein
VEELEGGILFVVIGIDVFSQFISLEACENESLL